VHNRVGDGVYTGAGGDDIATFYIESYREGIEINNSSNKSSG